MKVVGLTGGLATGKSLVAGMFHELGAEIVDADQIVRDVEQPGSDVLRQIADAFGQALLRADGSLDRKRLGALIFQDAEARQRLNAIVHPPVRLRIRDEIDALRRSKPQAIVIIDIPLLLDTAPAETFDLTGVIVVSAGRETQILRLMARDKISRDEAERRLAAQRPVADKAAEADWVIDNSAPAEETRRQVQAVWRQLTS